MRKCADTVVGLDILVGLSTDVQKYEISKQLAQLNPRKSLSCTKVRATRAARSFFLNQPIVFVASTLLSSSLPKVDRVGFDKSARRILRGGVKKPAINFFPVVSSLTRTFLAFHASN